MNILLVNSSWKTDGQARIGGVEYHRMFSPHVALSNIYPEHDRIMTRPDDLVNYKRTTEVLESGQQIPIESEEKYNRLDRILKMTDLVLFSRGIADNQNIDMVADLLERMNIPFGLDLDDFWHLPTNHISYNHYKEFKTSEATERSIQRAHFVTCTTPILAEEIRKLNPNVYVIENGIDSENWFPNKKESDRLRFGFTQGNTHYHDLKLISDSVVKSFSDDEFYNKAQVVLAGYQQAMKQDVSVQTEIEWMLTDNFNVIKDKVYRKQLKNLSMAEKKKFPYRRLWGRDVMEFSTIYDEIDVSVVPLEVNKFNSCKSELKMLEAGFKDCGIMVSHVQPYTLVATDKNSFDLNKKSFYEWAKYLLKNPNALEDSKAQLREDVEKYDLKHLTEKRHNLYKQYGKRNTAEVTTNNR